MSADADYLKLIAKRVATLDPVPAGPRKYWRAVVKCGKQNGVSGMTSSEVEWHAAACEAPRNDCHGCAP